MDKYYRAPNNIPDSACQHILCKCTNNTTGHTRKSYFRQDQRHNITYNILKDMILETCLCPDAYKVDTFKKKNIMRFRQYKDVIGYRGIDGCICHWLVVIATCNSDITTAYPVVDVFKNCGWNVGI